MLPQQFITIFLAHLPLFKGLRQDFQLNISYLELCSHSLLPTIFTGLTPTHPSSHNVDIISSRQRSPSWYLRTGMYSSQSGLPSQTSTWKRLPGIVQGTTNTTIHGNPSPHAFPKQSLIENSYQNNDCATLGLPLKCLTLTLKVNFPEGNVQWALTSHPCNLTTTITE